MPGAGDERAFVFRATDVPKLDMEHDGPKEFKTWKLKWDGYFHLSGLVRENDLTKYHALVSAFSQHTLDIVEGLEIGSEHEKDVDFIVKTLDEFVANNINKVRLRFNFNKEHQLQDESMKQYVNRLRKMIKECKYSDATVDLEIRDQAVIGCHDENIRQRLLEQKDLTLSKVIDIAESISSSKKDQEYLLGKDDIQKFTKRNSWKPSQRQTKGSLNQGAEPRCGKCGWIHEIGSCPALNKTCNRCQKFGHFAFGCKSKEVVPRKIGGFGMSINQAAHGDGEINLNLAEYNESQSPINIKCTSLITHKTVYSMMTPDSGAATNVAGINFALKLGIMYDKLSHTDIKLRSAFLGDAEILGKTAVYLEYEGFKSAEEFVILQKCTGPLLSKDACKRLHMITKDFPKPLMPPAGVALMRHCDKVLNNNKIIRETAKTLSKERLIAEFPHVFDGIVRTMPGEKYKIVLVENAIPFCVRTPRPISLPLKEKVKAELDLYEQQGIISKQTKATDWCAPIVVVRKKNSDKIRITMDFSKLNKFVKRERYMSNTPAQAIIDLKGAKIFSSFDAIKGYHQCELDEESQDLTTFITPYGTYKFLRAPYGVNSISEHYNRRMDECLEGLTNIAKIVDDCAIYSESPEEHETHVRKFLERCAEKQISLNPDKMQISQNVLRFGGHDLNQEGYSISTDITRSIAKFPKPDSRKALRGYFGLAQQLSTSNKDVAKVMEPLRGLLKTSNEFIWTPAHDEAFEESKTALSRTIRLKYYDLKKATRLRTDASRTGLGFVLQQKHEEIWKTVQTGSRFLTDTESRYAVIELEMLGVAWAIKKCKFLIHGLQHFAILTDHSPLVPILNSHRLDEIENPRLQRLRTRIMGYNFTAQHIKGKENDAPDALSRYPTDEPSASEELAELDPWEDNPAPTISELRQLYIQSLTNGQGNEPIAENLKLAEVREYAANDEEYIDLKRMVKDGFPESRSLLPNSLKNYWSVREHLSIEDDLLVHGVRLVIPKRLRAAMLTRMHEAHQGITRMQARARLIHYWPGIDSDIEDYVRACQHCQERQARPAKEPIIQKPRPERPFQEIAIDYAAYNGHIYLIIVDCKTDWPDIIRCRNDDTTAKQLIKDLRSTFCRTAVPDILWSDQGPQFTSKELKNFLSTWGVRHVMSSPRNPQSNGKVEATVKSMKNLIKSAQKGRQLNEDILAKALLQYRNTPNQRDGLSPAQKLFGRSIQDGLPAHRLAMSPKTQEEFRLAEKKAQKHDKKAAKYYNLHARSRPEFDVGQQVVVYNDKNELWNIHGTIVEKINDRRYAIKTYAGIILTRNKKFIRASHPPFLYRQRTGPGTLNSPGPGAANPNSAVARSTPIAATPPSTPCQRKSARQRKKPDRLVEDENWH